MSGESPALASSTSVFLSSTVLIAFTRPPNQQSNMLPTLFLASLALVATLSAAAPAPSAISPTSCKSYISHPGKDLIFAYDQGASNTILAKTDSADNDHRACIDWAKSQGFYVAVLSTDQVEGGKFKCFGKNVPHYPEFKGNMFRKIAWQSTTYLGPYNINGYDVPIRWSGTYGQGLSLCDSFTVEGRDEYKCKQFPQVAKSTILLASECDKPE
ncbi:hypothetical protein BCR44DRAFT_248882 [Catenaria anguillulae PL171]|uniref:Uncharacterized protein n=1 Tax=Catenaria anguillulae PL171 TaxID=765915 RepID=A0A1Y2HFI0_9FUNG|nr:hypothetical protein BCR44DRAFT_248882 [Catenaria anguillulae PL171]